MSQQQITNIVIVGGGTAGWMAAAALANFFKGSSKKIQLIESLEIGTVGVGEATVPGMKLFNRSLNINELDFLKQTQATFKLGIEFKDWHQKGDSFFHPFATFGMPISGQDFYHCWLKLYKSGMAQDLGNYCLPVMMAELNKFAQPELKPQTPLAHYNYAYHFDATLYARFLRRYAEALQVERIEAKITGVKLHGDNGFIESVVLDDGRHVHGDLFIDCSGFKGLLIEQALKTGYEDWSHWLPCNSAVAMQCENTQAPTPYTRSTALDAGWQWRIPLQHRVGNGYVYCNHFIGDDEAAATLQANLDGRPVTSPRLLKFTTGMRKQFWNKNCVSLGLASGFLEPLESTSIAMIQTGIAKLLMLFPDKSFNPALIAEANRLSRGEFERTRDFIILHYKLTQREDTELWRMVKAMEVPDSLKQKIELFKDRGHLIKYEQESFLDESWLAIYNGFKVLPKHYDTRIDGFDVVQLKHHLEQMRRAIRTGAEDAPSHAEFIASSCAVELMPS